MADRTWCLGAVRQGEALVLSASRTQVLGSVLRGTVNWYGRRAGAERGGFRTRAAAAEWVAEHVG